MLAQKGEKGDKGVQGEPGLRGQPGSDVSNPPPKKTQMYLIHAFF